MEYLEVRMNAVLNFHDGTENQLVEWKQPYIDACEEPDGPTVEEPPFVSIYRLREDDTWEWVTDIIYAGDVGQWPIACALEGFVRGFAEDNLVKVKVAMAESAKWLVKYWDYEALED